MKIEPRVIRLTDAPAYLGMGIKYFNEHVRPHVELVSIGYHMKMFDRLDLDRWFLSHKAASERPAKEKQSWQKEVQPASTRKAKSGTSKNTSVVSLFEQQLEKRKLSKRNGS